MRPVHKAILFLNTFGNGILSPVFSLILLARGCDFITLPLVMGVYSATVILCEVPTGVFADLFGRRRTFLLSCLLYGGSMVMLLLAHSVWLLLPGIVIYGLGRAFASGSLDALFVEDAVARLGEDRLSAVAGQLSLYQSVGLTLGSLAGGILPLMGDYSLHLVLRLILLAAPGLMCLFLVQERRGSERGRRPSLTGHLRACGGLLRTRPKLWGLLLCFLTVGGLLALVETFWQPVFLETAEESLRPLLGVVSAMGFGAVTAGNLITQRLRIEPGKAEWRAYFTMRVIVVLATLFFALRLGLPGFLVGYALIYLFIGGTDVLEQTLINRLSPDSQRASLLSVGSLTFQLGGLIANGIAAATVAALSFSGIFCTGAGILLAGTAGAALLLWRQGGRERTDGAKTGTGG